MTPLRYRITCIGVLLSAVLSQPVLASDWAGLPVSSSGYTNTANWLGWLHTEEHPWVWSENMQTWFYAPDPGPEPEGAWAYLFDFAQPQPGETSAQPVRVASFGPNGTHWPNVIPTPFMYDEEVAHIVEVECSWSAISAAISAVTEVQAAEGVLIRVALGSLTGSGSGSTANPVLQNLGSSSWSKRVTVAPRDGYGSVSVTTGVRIFKVKGVCFAGFDFYSLAFHANDRSALAWSKVEVFYSVNGAAGESLTDVEIVEVVVPDSALSGTDTINCFSAGASSITGYRFVGCYAAPRYRAPASGAHTDTIQFEPTSGGSDYTDVYMLDCAFFASSNCAIQVNAIDGLVVENTYIAAGATSKTRYPFMDGADTGGSNNCFNGGGINMVAYDSWFVGGISGSAGSWLLAENTRTTYTGTNVPVDGSWIVDNTLSETNPVMPPYPDSEYLLSIWSSPN